MNTAYVWNDNDNDVDECDIWAAASLFLEDEDASTASTESASPVKQEPLHHGPAMKTPTARTTSCTTSRPAKIRRVNRRREEILYLRQQAQQLEEQLTTTRARLDENEELQQQLSETERHLLSTAWSNIAAHQLNQRCQSEQEHDRLVAHVEEQRGLAKALHRYARRHTFQEIPAPLAVYAQLQSLHQTSLSVAMPATFDELERALQSMHQQHQAVFHDPRFDSVLSSLRAARVVNARTPQACIELVDARVLPFDVATTAHALWQSMLHRVATAVTYNNEDFDLHHDVIKKGFIAVLEMPHFQTSVCARVVARRFLEQDRVVILRATHFEPISLSHNSEIQPFSMRHYQWTVIEPPHVARLRENRFATAQIQSFDLAFPTLPEELDAATEKTILEFCQTAVEYHLDLSRQSVENILLAAPVGSNTLQLPSLQQASIKLEAC